MFLRYTDIFYGIFAGIIAVAVTLAGYRAAAAPAPWTGVVITANEKGHSLSIVDPRSGTSRTVRLSIAPHNVQSSADGRFLYVTGTKPQPMPSMPGMADMLMGPGYVLGFDLHKSSAKPALSLQVGDHPAHIVVDAASHFGYVTVSGEDCVKVLDLQRGVVAGVIGVGKMPHGLRMSPDGSMLYVADMSDEAVSFVDIASRKEVARVHVGQGPVQVAVAPDGKTVYVTLGGENGVAAVDVAGKSVIRWVAVGSNPAQLFVSPDGSRLYVANQGTARAPDRTVSVIDTNTFHVLRTINVGPGAHGVVVTPDGAHIFVTSAFGSRLAEIDAQTFAVRTFSLGAGPNGVTLGSL